MGYQVSPPVWSGSLSSSPFDISAITAQIDKAALSLKADERGSVTVQINNTGFGAGLIVRGPGRTSVLATVTKPMAANWGWNLSGRVAFAAELPPQPVAVSPELRGLYRLFRNAGNSKLKSALKAIKVAQGGAVTFRG